MGTRNKDEIQSQIEAMAAGQTVMAKAIIEQQKIVKATTKATWETLSRRERPLYVQSMRNDGYTQGEIGEMVGRSQSAISQYEKKYKLQNPKSDDE